MTMKIFIGSDHGGFRLKEELKNFLAAYNCDVEDMGAYHLDKNDDYPDFVFPVAEAVSKIPKSFGIVLGRSGNGEAIAANKVKGVRAALCFSEDLARLARQHNHANVLSMGADYIDLETATNIVKVFLTTQELSGRHTRRVKKIINYEEKA